MTSSKRRRDKSVTSYAERIAREMNAEGNRLAGPVDSGEILLLIMMGCRVPNHLREEAEHMRLKIRNVHHEKRS